ncbi:MAG TPA: OmpP1/FadL family transporter [Chitinolyticbacter sp.]|nr:OmpP1/FadL family transporter [Chitinolyticbacter sp.]
MKKIAVAVRMIGAGSLALMTGQALASGYHFGTQSASNQGVANSGAAQVMDASTIFYNPAGMTRLKGTNLTGVLNVIIPDGEFENDGSTSAAGRPIAGNDGGNFGSTTPVPHFYSTYQINDALTVGLGVFVPFGSHSDYDENWVGRYNSLENQVQTININPSIAYKVNNVVSLGAGVSMQYIKGKLSKAIDFGTGVAAQLGNPGLVPLLGANPTYDGSVVIKGDDIGYGFNLGALFEISESTRVGLAYRSKIKHELEGDADFTVPQTFASIAALGPAGAIVQAGLNARYQDTDAKLNIDTPESFSINGFHQINDQWTVTADYTRTKHSRLKELRVELEGRNDAVTVTDWNNTNRYSIGTTYKLNQQWLLRGGLAYDEAPEDDDNRIPGIPDSDRTWFAVGANYALTDYSSIDLAAIYVSLRKAPIEQLDENGSTVRGDYDVNSITLGAQYNHRF